jgi:Arc/MetJ family transcription regulator
MKRTPVVRDEQVLEEAKALAGKRTDSATVDFALAELVRRARASQILELAGSGAWEGDLGEMRGAYRPERDRAGRTTPKSRVPR